MFRSIKTKRLLRRLECDFTANVDPIIDEGSGSGIIVSLTTYSHRIEHVYLTIQSIANQTKKPQKIILWLDEKEFSVDDLPSTLVKQIECGLTVKFTSDTGSYKKLFPAIENYPGSHIVTVDDDILYPPDMLETMCSLHQENPESIIACRGHKITRDNQSHRLAYRYWLNEVAFAEGDDLFITTGGGVLFPSSSTRDDFFRQSSAIELCPNADDIWINTVIRKQGLKVKKVTKYHPYRKYFTFLDDHKGVELKAENVLLGKNDIYLKRVEDHFNIKW